MNLSHISSTLEYDPEKKIFYVDHGSYNTHLSEMERREIQDENGKFDLSKYLMRFVGHDIDIIIHDEGLHSEKKYKPLKRWSVKKLCNKCINELFPQFRGQDVDPLLIADYFDVSYELAHKAHCKLIEEGYLILDEPDSDTPAQDLNNDKAI